MDVPEKLFIKYKTPLALSRVEAKRDLLSKMLRRDAKIIGGSEPILAEALLPQVPYLSEDKLDALLEPRIYKESPSSFDPKTRERSGRRSIEMVAQFENARRANAKYRWSAKRVAKHLYPKWQDRFGSLDSFSRTYFKHLQTVRSLQKLRDDQEVRQGIVKNLIVAYRQDAHAMTLLSILLYYGQAYETSTTEEEAANAIGAIDALYQHQHPFVSQLVLAISSMPVLDLWEKTSELFEKIKNDDSRKALLSEFGLGDRDPDEFIEQILKQFKLFKLH